MSKNLFIGSYLAVKINFNSIAKSAANKKIKWETAYLVSI